MRSLVRILSALALAAIVAPASASAAKKPKPAAWAAKHHLKGAWRAKDADRDGLANLQEFKLTTNPRKADSDRDGLKDGDEVTSGNNPRKADSDGDRIKDGAEHAGVVTAFDGETVTIRQFHGPKLTASLDCGSDNAPVADNDESGLDDGYVEMGDEEYVEDDDLSADAATVDGEEAVIDLGDEEDDCELAEGDVLRSATLERIDGDLFVVAFEIA